MNQPTLHPHLDAVRPVRYLLRDKIEFLACKKKGRRMLVRFWGTRGSIPTPGSKTARYGGNTSCVEIRSDDGSLFVIDCGTGIRELGQSLLAESKTLTKIHLLIGHTHWDHIQGFPFFTPIFFPGIEINIYAPIGFQRSLEEALSGQMQYSYFPVKLQDLSSRIRYTELAEGFFRIGNCLIETQYLNHTAPTIAYRITEGSTRIAYVSDHEPFWKPSGTDFTHPGDQRHIEFMRDADLLIHDAQYSDEEYRIKVGWGHSPVGYVRDIALAANVKQLALFHHDPAHDDAWIDAMEQEVKTTVAQRIQAIDVFAAAERMVLEVHGHGSRSTARDDSALQRRSIAGERVLLVSPNDSDFTMIERMLVGDGLVLMPVSDTDTALKRAEAFSPSLVIMDACLLHTNTDRFAERLRDISGKPHLPIMILTDNQETVNAEPAAGYVSDYIERPFNPPMLRSRVRAWLARTVSENLANDEPIGDVKNRDRGAAEPQRSETRDADTLAQTTLFRHLDSFQRENLISNATEQIFPPGHAILREGETGTSVFIILSGRVRIIEAIADTPHVDMFLGEVGPGEVFGEIAFLRDVPRSATAIALERTRCLLLSQNEFSHILLSSPALCIALLRVLASRLANADWQLARYAPDALTSLPRRRALHDLYHRLVPGAQRRKSRVMLLLFDVENLRGINDEFGYGVGDDALRAMSEALLVSSRAIDLIARYSGDEFVVLLLDATAEECTQIDTRVSERLAKLVSKQVLPVEVRYDIGMGVSDDVPENIDTLLRAAHDEIQKKRAARREAPPGSPTPTPWQG